jgi:hypothetical protein
MACSTPAALRSAFRGRRPLELKFKEKVGDSDGVSDALANAVRRRSSDELQRSASLNCFFAGRYDPESAFGEAFKRVMACSPRR